MENIYRFTESGQLITPALIYYRDRIQENIRHAVSLAGGPEHLWPHVKTHKMAEMVRLQMEAGITRFKCATVAEAEMAAQCGASNVLLAYPLVGPNIRRFLALTKAFPSVSFWAIGDDREQLRLLGKTFSQAGMCARLLADVNLGMNRTGVGFSELVSFYLDCSRMEGIRMEGLHCYDGHRTEHDFESRITETQKSETQIRTVCDRLKEAGCDCPILVMGGSSSAPCYRQLTEEFSQAYCSPGTFFVNDYGYTEKFPDLVFPPAAAILTRVVSCPLPGHFTLDLGYKGIASDPDGPRGVLAGMDHVRELFQSEEHWAFSMEPGYEQDCPKVGDELFVVPTHICPTSALYPAVSVVDHGSLCATWHVTARNRQITY